MAVAGKRKLVVGSRHLPSVQRPEKQMESSGVAVEPERPSSVVVTVQNLVRAVADTETEADVGVVTMGNRPESVYSWVVGRFGSCRRDYGCGPKVCEKQ